MKFLCEVVSTSIMPTLRSLLAHELLNRYGLNQTEVSYLLGITQPAISQYRKGVRGQKSKALQSNKEIMELVKNLSADIAMHKVSAIEVHTRICQISEEIIARKILGTEEVLPGPCVIGVRR